MASLSELIAAADYKRRQAEASDPIASGVRALVGGLNTGFEQKREDSRLLDIFKKQQDITSQIQKEQQDRSFKNQVALEAAKLGEIPNDFVGNQVETNTPLIRLAEASKKRIISSQQQDNLERNNKLFDLATGLRKELTSSPVYKDYTEINRAATNIESAYSRSLSSDTKDKLAVDQALVVSFNKLLDPGSVVRESEFARTPEGQALIRAYAGKAQQLFQGGVGLTPEGRFEIKRMADDLLKNAQGSIKKQISVYENLANQFGIPKELVFGGLDEGFDSVGGSEAVNSVFGSVKEAEAANLPVGTIITINGRRAIIE